MRRLLTRLRCDSRGTAMLEFAFALPLLVSLMMALLQLAMVLHASGGMRHAVGEGVRFARVHRDATAEEVIARIEKNYSGIERARVRSLAFQRGMTAAGEEFARASMLYEAELVIPFIPRSLVTLSETRLVYLPE